MITSQHSRKTKVKNPAKKAYEIIAPLPEDLWERGGATMRKIEMDDGRHEEVPFFDSLEGLSWSDFEESKVGKIIDHKGQDIGEHYSYNVTTADGIDRTARIYIPRDGKRSYTDLYIHADTAWLTTITGHNDYAASSFVSRTGLPMVIVGAEHGTNKHPYPRELGRVATTFRNSPTISLAKSAQSSQLITTVLQEKFDLPNKMIKTGESRGAMLAAGHFPYAKEYENTIPYVDITAPCIPERLLSEREDWMRLAKWPKSEILGTIALGLELAEKKILKRHMGTVALNPNFLLSNFTGVGPALFSGEAGRFAAWVPADIVSSALYISTFKNDTVSRPDVWRQKYKDHENVYIREHPNGSHMTLAHDEVLDTKAVRINMFQTIHNAVGGIRNQNDFQTIIESRRNGETNFVYQSAA
jgi:hypothetical protein